MSEGLGLFVRPWVKKYVAAVALNGVSVNYPRIDPDTRNWLLFDPVTAAYTDSGVPAIGPRGETPQFRMNDRTLQYRFATQTPTEWTDLYEFPLSASYTHTQAVPAATWNAQHNLGSLALSVLTVDASGEQIVGQTDAPASTSNLLVIRFSEPIAGKAYIKV
jgi:hypothetical protein